MDNSIDLSRNGGNYEVDNLDTEDDSNNNVDMKDDDYDIEEDNRIE